MSRVLVVEDEAHLAKGLRFNLEAEGHSVEVSGDGESALERLVAKNEEFDVVVLDVMLPGKDGFAVVSTLRKAHNYVPVLILTARGRPEDVLQGFAAGADDYLPKPFQLPIFLARLQGLLRRSQWLVAEKSVVKGRAANGKETSVNSGAAANSAVCYCLGITSVDPAEKDLDLLMERFMSESRNEPPDIDIDFEHERREEVIQYIYRK